MFGLVWIFGASGCAPGGLGFAGSSSINPDDDLADRMRDCGLLTEGITPYSEQGNTQYGQCISTCYIEATCDDLTSMACGSGQVSDAVYICVNACELEEFTCHDGSETIPGDYVCDLYDDCMDGSDENDCWTSGSFQCHDGSGSVPEDWVCDMYDDCMDGSDEIGCAQLLCPGGGTW